MVGGDKTRTPDGCSPPHGAGDREQRVNTGQHVPTDIRDKNLCLTYQPADSSP